MFRRLIFTAILTASATPSISANMPYDINATTGAFSVSQSYLTFAGTDPAPGTTSGGTATLTDLGTFSLVSLPPTSAWVLSGNFDLTLTLTVPDGANAVNPIVATVTGTINQNQANNVFINFGLGQTINFSGVDGSGSFILTVNDVTFPDHSVAGAHQLLTGSITNALFTPPGGGAVPSSAVPVPATLALLGIGFAGLGISRRRKH